MVAIAIRPISLEPGPDSTLRERVVTVYTASAVVAAPIDHVFEVVADVERYPDFVPLWRDAQIRHRDRDGYVTEQEVGLGRVVRRFSTRTALSRPHRIAVSTDEALFREFFIRWDFAPVGSGCRISVALSWELSSAALQKSLDQVLPQVARSIITAFEKRFTELET